MAHYQTTQNRQQRAVSLIRKLLFTAALILFVAYCPLFADEPARAGIGIRGSYWNFVNNGNGFEVESRSGFTRVSVGGYGGSIYFFSRISEQMFLEFSLGAIGSVDERSYRYYNGENVDATVIAPILLGIRLNFLPLQVNSALQPYAVFGGGPYWLSDVEVREAGRHDEEVLVRSTTKPGLYAGGGLNFLLGKHFALNYDMKYHWVDFPSDRFNNGFEFAVGFSVMWGTYKGNSRG